MSYSKPSSLKTELCHSDSEEETLRIAKNVGRSLTPPRVILLYGELGSGKTLFTRGIATSVGVVDSSVVRSPSFTLVNQYTSPTGPIYHIDLYRLEGFRDLYSIGIEEILSSSAIVIIEWAEKLLIEPKNPIQIRILVDPTTDRRQFEIKNL